MERTRRKGTSNRLRSGNASAQTRIREGRGAGKKEEETVKDIGLGVRKGDALVRIAVGMTKTEHFNSVRADAQVELPSGTDDESLKKTAAEATAIAREIMEENIAALQDAMNGVEKEGKADDGDKYA